MLFRTQSMALISAMTDFFRLWCRIEQAHLLPLTGASVEYALGEGKFIRSISAPDVSCSSQELASALSEYITLFDNLMKAYLAGRLDAHGVESAYYAQMLRAPVHI